MDNKVIDPWKGTEIKDYKRIMAEFGIEDMSKLVDQLPVKNPYFFRGVIFGHKDFKVILDAVKNKKPFVMMTGLMPSGRFHIGHKIIADLMVYFQELGAECYICVADIESYLTRNISLEEGRNVAIEEYLLNYIASGLKPSKTRFYFQSEGSKNYMNLSKFIAGRTTFNELKAIYGDLTPQKIVSAFTQVADILHPQLKENGGPKPVVVPVGVDQLPHLNLCRDIAGRMREYKFVSPSAIFTKLIPGLKGIHTKMSSSDPDSAIFLTDDERTVENKIKKYAFSGGQASLEEHRKKGGNPDVDVSFQYLKLLFEPDDKKLDKIYNDYKSGKLLTSELKEILIEKINKFLKIHRANREKAKKMLDKFIIKN
ncbi:MAG TPA: tryptophan--tRNA ligase [Candidatus Nanoarchaeia archaeon]|nr:tryptophan--tRNA ligase [Candidatus Nanoarchaeia archaeon]